MWKQGEVTRLIARSSHVISKQGLTIKVSPTSLKNEEDTGGTPPGRLVVVVPKRIGCAPIRNRNKRRLKAVVYTLGKDPEGARVNDRFDLIIFVRRSIATMPYEQLQAVVKEAYIHVLAGKTSFD